MKYTEGDLKIAREIVGPPEKKTYFGFPHLQMREEIAKAVAEGIATGRKQGREKAIASLESEIVTALDRMRQISD